MPPWVLRMRTSLAPRAAGSHPMPAFCVQPKRSPDGRASNISGVSGSDPWGPGAVDCTSNNDGSPESRMSSRRRRITGEFKSYHRVFANTIVAIAPGYYPHLRRRSYNPARKKKEGTWDRLQYRLGQGKPLGNFWRACAAAPPARVKKATTPRAGSTT